jgi:hypothetical protein
VAGLPQTFNSYLQNANHTNLNLMKKINILYWVFTALFCSFMLFSAIPDALLDPEAVAFTTKLGYPVYFTSFIGVAKILGVIGILAPDLPGRSLQWSRLKEWAYAGLFFDLLGAAYSIIMGGEPGFGWLFMLLPLSLGLGSYMLHHRRLRLLKAEISEEPVLA